ncbi:hypothetical protein [Haliscomenobacter hydrossis]|uniref:Uncharacterized protein n=1 Tax=Haliscomenobacter hydrossis (strain ATCC 27775 / DSM 1100 / LMG 10767 / O) TaxID=760192 RepID=F4L555_HALH1|nr:hypothetical protein [Haliscomenobacter hydrossis]AEE48776.1 hypothetical protein Halhy_0872 [Haliscomenobacter hydrossis DSM 1100]
MLPHPEIDLASIEAIVSNPNPVLRNLQITQTYSELNLALTKLLGKTNVSWCAYATWASKTAGKFIRLDNVDAAITEFLRGKDWIHALLEVVPGALTWFGWKVNINDSVLLKILSETAGASATEVAKGNLLVFAELAPLYAQFIHIVSGKAEQKEAELETFLNYLKNSQNGQDYEKLVQAYSTYQQSIFETEPKAKAELLLLANVLVGYHEQIRLDPAINNSLNAPIEQVFKKKLLGGLERLIEASMPRFLFYLIAPILKASLNPVINKMAAHWRTISTRQLMRIEVPDGHLDLSEDIPLITYNPKRMFPLDLETIHNADLQKVLATLDRSPDSTTGTAAKDWGDLGERMNFIADFFRSDQQDKKLFLPPFNQEQTWAIKNGQIPEGKL